MLPKGEMSLLKFAMGLLFAVPIVLILLVLLNAFFDIGSGERNATFENFDNLIVAVKQVMDNQEDFYYLENFGLYVGEEEILVSFNNDDFGAEDHCDDPETIARPDSIACNGKACLCVYPQTSGDDDFDTEDLPLRCEALPGVDYIFTLDYYTGPSDEGNNKQYTTKEAIYQNFMGGDFTPENQVYYQDTYAQFMLYGECEDWDDDIKSGPIRVYIEKIKDDKDKTYIFIAHQDIETVERYKARYVTT